VILFFAAILTFAQQAEVVYVEGLADIREAAGSRYEATFGDGLYAGDAVLTGSDGRVDLEQADSSTIRIAADTVFTVKEVGISGERNTVYSTPVGSAFFRFRTLVGKEPRVSTPSSTAGVRGTAFAVFAGVDGSTLYVVEEGRVDVTAQGTTVELGAGEGVEVSVGSQPGEKFEVKRGQIDYADWNAERLNAMLEDPVAAVAGVARRMDEFVDSIREIAVEYEENRNRLESERDKLESIEEEKGKDARTQYYSDTVFPLEVETSYQRLNLRYYALSALSLRRYVMAGIYLRVKPRYLTNPRSDVYLEFLSIYRTAADQFEREITPYLVDADF
jgi:hypothetical protein